MPLWSNTATGNTGSALYNPPKYVTKGVGHLANSQANKYSSLYGFTATQAKYGGSGPEGLSSGWVFERLGVGQVKAAAVTTGNTGWTAAKTYQLVYTGLNQTGNTVIAGSTDTVVANSTGGIDANTTNSPVTVGPSSQLYYSVSSVMLGSDISTVTLGSANGTGYTPSTTYYLQFGNTGGSGANVSVTSNTTGGIPNNSTITYTSRGNGYTPGTTVTGLTFANGTPASGQTVSLTFGTVTANGQGQAPVFSVTLGGKAGRRFTETLVALNSLSNDAANTPAQIV